MSKPNEDQIRVLRIVEYTGPRAAVEAQVARSIHGMKQCNTSSGQTTTIRAATIGLYPEILDAAVLEQVIRDGHSLGAGTEGN